MSTDPLEVSASFIDVAHQWNEADVGFFRSLPGVQFRFVDPETGRAAVPAPSVGNNVRVIVLAMLSSTVLSTTIHDYLPKQPTTITITVENGSQKKTLAFSGPNLKESQPQIEAMLKELTKDASEKVTVTTMKKSKVPPINN
jgi:hypothetical protein